MLNTCFSLLSCPDGMTDTLDENYGLRDSIAPHLQDGTSELDALMQRNVLPAPGFDRATPTSGFGRMTPNGYYTPQRIASPNAGVNGASPFNGSYQYCKYSKASSLVICG